MIGHDSTNIAPSVAATVMMLPTTFDSVDVNACWAPCTSLFSRVTSEPVWARVKNPIGMRWTWSNTCVRRSWIRPSPMRAENQRWARSIAAPTMASPAMSNAIATTRSVRCSAIPSSMMRAIQQWCDGARDGAHDDEHEEQRERHTVGTGEAEDPAHGARRQAMVLDRLVEGEGGEVSWHRADFSRAS